MKAVLLWGGVGIVIAGGLVVVLSFANPQQDSSLKEVLSQTSLSVPIGELDHIKGNRNAVVTLTEYGDFQCPACRAYFPFLAQLEQEFGDQIAFVYRHFPLRNIHPNAQDAAQASEAAAMQGKFWEMHDILFNKQDDWAKEENVEDIFVEYAISLGLNPDQFRKDYTSDKVKDRVQKDFEIAIADGLNSTPSFFLGGVRLQNPQSYDEFQQAILAALAEYGQQPEIQQSSEPTGDSTQEGS